MNFGHFFMFVPNLSNFGQFDYTLHNGVEAEIVFGYSDSREFFFENPRLKLPSGLTSRLSVPQNVIVLGLDSWEHLK